MKSQIGTLSSASNEGKVYPIVMAGGSGTRFWPLSRRSLPKQFLSIGTKDSLILETLNRLDTIAPWAQRYVVAGPQHAAQIQAHCPLLPKKQLLIEPCARNTAPCVALAAQHIAKRDPQGIMILLPADHHISDVDAFQQALKKAVEGAQEGKILTLGIVPTRAETGYGYIQYPGGGEVNQSRLSVTRFVEKPPKNLAEQYVASGEYLWNSGVFVFSVARILQEFESQLAPLSQSMKLVYQALVENDDTLYQQTLDHAFETVKPISIDVGIMEAANNLEVIPLSAGWSDVGHWGALNEVYESDEQQNIVLGHPQNIIIDGQRVTLHSDRFTALIGVDDLVVVNTEDATLICSKDRVQDVRLIVDYLHRKQLDKLI